MPLSAKFLLYHESQCFISGGIILSVVVLIRIVYCIYPLCHYQGFQSGQVPGTFTRLRSCIVPEEITEPPKISGGQNHKYDGR
jgi:hypothetical protein